MTLKGVPSKDRRFESLRPTTTGMRPDRCSILFFDTTGRRSCCRALRRCTSAIKRIVVKDRPTSDRQAAALGCVSRCSNS
jgi:hypothetical protein